MRWAYVFTGFAAVAVGVGLYVTSGDAPEAVDPQRTAADGNDLPVVEAPRDDAEPEAPVAVAGEPRPSIVTDPVSASSEDEIGEPETDSQQDEQPPIAAADVPVVPTHDGEVAERPTGASAEAADRSAAPPTDSTTHVPTSWDEEPAGSAAEPTPIAGTSDPEVSDTSVTSVVDPEVDAANAGSEPPAVDEERPAARLEPAAPEEPAPSPVAVVQLPERTSPDPDPSQTETETLDLPAGVSATAAPEPADLPTETAPEPAAIDVPDGTASEAEPTPAIVDEPSAPSDVPEALLSELADSPPDAVADVPEPSNDEAGRDAETPVAAVAPLPEPADPQPSTVSDADDATSAVTPVAPETEVAEPAEVASSDADPSIAGDAESAEAPSDSAVEAFTQGPLPAAGDDEPLPSAVEPLEAAETDEDTPLDDAADGPAPAVTRALEPSPREPERRGLEGRPELDDASDPASPVGDVALADEGSASVAVAPLAPAPIAPSFDAVRVSGGGNLVIAGTAPPDARVSVVDGGVPIGEAVADGAGQWVYIADGPLDPGSYEIALVAEPDEPSGEEAVSDQVLVIVVPESARDIAGNALSGEPDRGGPLAVLVPRGAVGPSVVLQAPQAPVGPVAARDPEPEDPVTRSLEAPPLPSADDDVAEASTAVAEPDADVTAASPETAPAEDEMEDVAALPAAPPPPPSPEVVVSVVDYDDRGRFFVSGTADAGAALRLYLDNRILLEDRATEDGAFVLAPRDTVAPGLYRLRVDHVDAGGAVIARSEIPFQRNPPVDPPPGHQRITVQPGNSLWVLARGAYGDGLQYSVIFQANRDQIRDPDLIYPGQVFVIPAVPQSVPLGDL